MTVKKLISYLLTGLATLALTVSLPGCPKSSTESKPAVKKIEKSAKKAASKEKKSRRAIAEE